MNQLDNNSVAPVYMSQVEANEVMELWAQRQREEAERQGMVTVHDVAEATQLSPQEVQQLLQTIRTTRSVVGTPPKSEISRSEEIPLLPAIIRVLPLTGIPTFLLGVGLENKGMQADWFLSRSLMLWSFAMAIFAASKYINRLTFEARIGRAVKKQYGSER